MGRYEEVIGSHQGAVGKPVVLSDATVLRLTQVSQDARLRDMRSMPRKGLWRLS